MVIRRSIEYNELVRTQKDTANIGVTPRSGVTIPRYILQEHLRIIFKDLSGHIPRYTITRQSLFHHIHSTFINSRSSRLQSSLRQIERMSCNTKSEKNKFPATLVLLLNEGNEIKGHHEPTRTAEAP